MQQTTISKSPRVEVVDALRGFAVLAILLVHNVEHFIYPVYPDPATLPGWLNVLNEGVFTVVFALFAGKSYSIFALLLVYLLYTVFEPAGEGKRLRLPLPLEITAVDDLRYVERRFLSGRRCFAAVCDRGRCFVYRA